MKTDMRAEEQRQRVGAGKAHSATMQPKLKGKQPH